MHSLQYTFPFEGNWNLNPPTTSSGFAGLLYTFPFEGNWNFWRFLNNQRNLLKSCYTLSRLKGIETKLPISFLRVVEHLAIHFPVWRELKHNSRANPNSCCLFACNTLSRLKGIETQHTVVQFTDWSNLLYTFPFEGNWNSFSTTGLFSIFPTLAIHFPVWRELKRYGPVALNAGHWLLAIHFPVWRELKRVGGTRSIRNGRVTLQYTFPFEGNWNSGSEPSSSLPPDLAIHFPVWREWKPRVRFIRSATFPLAIHFPVWREWKLVFRGLLTVGYLPCNTLSRLKGMETCVPFPFRNGYKVPCNTLSRLKGMETFSYFS